MLVQGLKGSWEGETSGDSARGMVDSICFVVLIFSVGDEGGPCLWKCIF